MSPMELAEMEAMRLDRSYPKEATMRDLLKRLWQEEAGQDLTEYALLIVLIALVAVVGMKSFGSAVSNTFSNAASNLNTTTT